MHKVMIMLCRYICHYWSSRNDPNHLVNFNIKYSNWLHAIL